MKIGYARESVGDPLDPQRKALKDAGCVEIFEDLLGETLKTKSPGLPKLAQAISKATAGDVLVVCQLNRIGRSTTGFVDLVIELGERRVFLQSLDPAEALFDTSSEPGCYLQAFAKTLTRLNHDLQNERVAISRHIAKTKGRTGGRPPSLSQQKLDLARTLIDQGQPVRLVAVTIGCSQATLYRQVGAKVV